MYVHLVVHQKKISICKKFNLKGFPIFCFVFEMYLYREFTGSSIFEVDGGGTFVEHPEVEEDGIEEKEDEEDNNGTKLGSSWR